MLRHRASVLLLASIVAACNGPAASPVSTATPSASPSAAPGTAAAAPTASPRYAPTPRTSAAITWDPKSARILLFGGDTRAGATNVLDAWDGTSWTKLTSLGPPSRDDGLLVADPVRGVVVLAGGRNGQTILTDTWEWDGAAWKEMDVAAPTPRAHAAAAYDPVSKRVLVYGGVSETGTLRDTWAWDGTAWTQLETKGIPARVPNGMAWDPTLKKLLVLAVDLDAPSTDQTYPSELWGWSGNGWELVAKGGPSFSPLQQFVEGPKHPWLVDGGVVKGAFSTYEWTGEAWFVHAGAAPPLRNGQAAAFDPVRHELVMFGGLVGNTVLGDTWLLDNSAWHEVAP